MNPGAAAIPVGFVILTFLLLWYTITAEGKWWIKAILIFILPSFGIAVWQSLGRYLGWPAADTTANKFIMAWAEVREPNPKTNDKGAVYIWLYPFDSEDVKAGILDYKKGFGEPRAYKTPYSRKLFEQILEARIMIQKGGVPVFEKDSMGVPKDGSGASDGQDGEGDQEGNPDENNGQGTEGGDNFKFYELPPSPPPNKN